MDNKKYDWQHDCDYVNGYILFNLNKLETTWGNGTYKKIADRTYILTWQDTKHILTFNEDFTRFKSVRQHDLHVSSGKIKLNGMKTVFDDILIGWEDFHDNQLLRCKTHKQYEGDLLLNMPINSSFLDIGSHFGDTILTMALYAKNNKRDDIRFFSFEPNITKFEHIQKINKMNNLNIICYNCCVGNINGKGEPDGTVNPIFGSCSYKVNNNGNTNIIQLNDIYKVISPVGLMHIDTEGWETKVIQGSSKIFENVDNQFHVIAECWSNEISIMRGFSEDPEKDIITEMKKYNSIRLNDMVDEDRNLVFKVNYN